MINGAMLRDCFISAAHALMEHEQELNEMNVFPVPDRDTGANMAITMHAAKKIAEGIADNCRVDEAADRAAAAMLRSSRGNSGAILSLLFRGFAKGLSGCSTCSAAQFTAALKCGVSMAYDAVFRPTEGTILTVARECVSRSEIYLKRKPSASVFDIVDFMSYVAEETLKKTPEMLEALAEEGVTDAGAKGFCCILEAMAYTLSGKGILPETKLITEIQEDVFVFMKENAVGGSDGNIPVTYRLFLDMAKESLAAQELIRKLEECGNSVVAAEQDGAVRFQVITSRIFEAVSAARNSGTLLYSFGTAHGVSSKVKFHIPGDTKDENRKDIRYRYCTEFQLLRDIGAAGDREVKDELLRILYENGDSAAVIVGDDIIKCHVHTNVPETLIGILAEKWYMTEMKIEDMYMQM